MKLPALLATSAIALGCNAPAVPEVDAPGTDSPAPAAAAHSVPTAHSVQRSYVLHVGSDGVTLEPAGQSAGAHALSTPEVTSVQLDLVTDASGDACPSGMQYASARCLTMRVTQLLDRSTTNTFVQVTSITAPDGTPLGSEDAFVFNTDMDGVMENEDQVRGYWEYTAAGAEPGVLAAAPHNQGERTWGIINSSGAAFDVNVTVYASLAYTWYGLDGAPAQPSFIDACAAGTSLGSPDSASFSLPFDFTMYATNTTSVTASRYGVLTFAGAAAASSGASSTLPSASAPVGALFPFWDDLQYGANSEMCWDVIGAAPSRQVVVTWKHMSLPGADGPADLNFSALLAEGSSEIELVYGTMSGPTGRALGSSATIGTQNADASLATSAADSGFDLTSDVAWQLWPVP